MPSENDFLQAIHDSPEDDTLRLVFADWLDDQDHPRARLFRLTVQLPQLAPKERARKAQEARRLEEEQKALWMGDLAQHVYFWQVRRGLVVLETMAYRISEAVRSASAAPFWPWVEELTLVDVKLPAILEEFLGCPQLVGFHRLILRACSAEVVIALAACSHLKQVRWLSTDSWSSELNADAVVALAESAYVANLTMLDISHINFGMAGAQALATSPNLANLRTLRVFDKIGEDAREMLVNRFGNRVGFF